MWENTLYLIFLTFGVRLLAYILLKLSIKRHNG